VVYFEIGVKTERMNESMCALLASSTGARVKKVELPASGGVVVFVVRHSIVVRSVNHRFVLLAADQSTSDAGLFDGEVSQLNAGAPEGR
jgi:hypothetical protein